MIIRSGTITLRSALILFVISLQFSCKFFSGENPEKRPAVARVYDYFLYPEDLEDVIRQGTSAEDSINIVKSYIDNWVHSKSVIHLAEKNLDDEKKNVEKELQEYRNSLITYAYEKDLVNQKLDTNVSDEEIQTFYKIHPQNFELKNNIIKVLYLKLNKKSPKLDKVRIWYKSESKKDRALLEEYCHQYAMNYYLDDETWLLFDDLLKEIPIKTYDQEQFLQNNRSVEIEDSSMVYLVSIKGFMIKNSTSPLSFEKKNIVALIMNERKLKLIEEMENEAYEVAHKNGEVEIFESVK